MRRWRGVAEAAHNLSALAAPAAVQASRRAAVRQLALGSKRKRRGGEEDKKMSMTCGSIDSNI